MGQEVPSSRFNKQDFKAFERLLQLETEQLRQWFQEQAFGGGELKAGFEMEAWLIDTDYRPAPRNEEFFSRCQSPMIVPELAKFNIEYNVEPQVLHGSALSLLRHEINNTTALCHEIARQMDINIVMMGVLPTRGEDDLTLAHWEQ